MSNPNRRTILKLAGLSSLNALGMPFSSLASAIDNLSDHSRQQALGDADYSLLVNLVDIIFPETDTPSASKAGVHIFIDFMYGQWMDDKHRAIFERGLKQVEHIARRTYKNSFLKLDDTKRAGILSAFEADPAEDADKTEHAKNRAFFGLLKHLTIVGYFTSETGVKEALKHDPLPGEYLGCLEVGRDYKNSYIDTFREVSQRGYANE